METPRFESTSHPIRTRLATAGLVGVGGSLLAGLGPCPRGRHRAEQAWAATTRRVLRMRVDTGGLDRIDPDERYVLAPLHEGLVDPVLLLGLPLRLRFVVRDELLAWRHLGRYLRRSRHLVADNESSISELRRLHREAAAAFGSGDSLVVFPQGSVLGVEIAFRPGAFRLAERFERPLLPIVITGTHRVWEHPFSPTLRYGQKASVQVLDPIPPDRVRAAAAGVERRMKEIALGSDTAPVRRFRPEQDGWWDNHDYEIDPAFPELQTAVAARRLDRTA